MITEPLPLTALIGVATVAAFWLDWRFAALSRVGASLLALVLGAVLSNAGLVPATSPVYDAIAGPVTLLAVAWLLLAVNVSDLRRAGPRMTAAFAIALVGTALGAFTGAFLFAGALGENTWRLAGPLTGTYSGGSVNFVAVAQGVGLPPALFAGANAADALLTGLWLGATLLLPVWMGQLYPPVPAEATEHPSGVPHREIDKEEHHPFFLKAPLSTLDLAKLMALGLLLLAAAELFTGWLAGLADRGRVPGWLGSVPTILWLTTFALLVGHTERFRRPEGALQLGTLALHFFFVVIGIWARVADIVAVGAAVFLYTATVVTVHGLVVYGVGRLVRLDVGSLSVASQAAVGGPSSALAVAVSREWPGLVLPGIIVGLAGYAVGNYVGFAVAYAVRGLGLGM